MLHFQATFFMPGIEHYQTENKRAVSDIGIVNRLVLFSYTKNDNECPIHFQARKTSSLDCEVKIHAQKLEGSLFQRFLYNWQSREVACFAVFRMRLIEK